MTDRELEMRLKNAVEACTPDVLDKVMAECDTYSDKVIPFAKKKNMFYRYAAVAAACLVLVGAGMFGFFGLNLGRVASIVSLEINPSIELRIDKRERVLEANAMNKDAVAILEGMKLEGTDIHTATNAIVGSLLKHGYIDELANSILLSVEDKDSVRGTELQKTLSQEINAILDGAAVNAAILSQYVDGAAVEKQAEEHHISHGKAALIERILEANNTYVFDELAALSVNELNLLIENPHNEVKDVESTGEVSSSAYIGVEEANKIAFSHAGIEENSVYDLETEIDYEHHAMIYEVEFTSNGREYEYDIDATTGNILSNEHEHHHDD